MARYEDFPQHVKDEYVPDKDRPFLDAQRSQAKGLEAVAEAIGRLAQAVENANAIAMTHNQWLRREAKP